MSSMTPEQRRLRAQVAAHTSWANTSDPAARTANARKAGLDRFEQQVDPDGMMDPAERARRAEHARKAYFKTLALKSAKVRAEKAARKKMKPPPNALARTRTDDLDVSAGAEARAHSGKAKVTERLLIVLRDQYPASVTTGQAAKAARTGTKKARDQLALLADEGVIRRKGNGWAALPPSPR